MAQSLFRSPHVHRLQQFWRVPWRPPTVPSVLQPWCTLKTGFPREVLQVAEALYCPLCLHIVAQGALYIVCPSVLGGLLLKPHQLLPSFPAFVPLLWLWMSRGCRSQGDYVTQPGPHSPPLDCAYGTVRGGSCLWWQKVMCLQANLYLPERMELTWGSRGHLVPLLQSLSLLGFVMGPTHSPLGQRGSSWIFISCNLVHTHPPGLLWDTWSHPDVALGRAVGHSEDKPLLAKGCFFFPAQGTE